MDYCTAHFGKQLSELTYEDIETYFQKENTETDQLEFKSNSKGNPDDRLKSIQKTICAFLNSSGGLLIWGAPEGIKIDGRKELVFTGGLTPHPAIIEKDFIINKISDAISPLPAGIRVSPITKDGKSIVVIEVDSSEYAPHQTGNIYYMRLDGQSRPAPHHYIEALFKKIKYPNIEVFLKHYSISVGNVGKLEHYTLNFRLWIFNWSPLQNEENLYYRIVSPGIFSEFLTDNNAEGYFMNGRDYRSPSKEKILYYGEPYTRQFTLLFHKSLPENSQATMFISFGGKYSPFKQSRYKIDLRNYPDNSDKILIPEFENKLIKDIHDDLRQTKEEIIKFALGEM